MPCYVCKCRRKWIIFLRKILFLSYFLEENPIFWGCNVLFSYFLTCPITWHPVFSIKVIFKRRDTTLNYSVLFVRPKGFLLDCVLDVVVVEWLSGFGSWPEVRGSSRVLSCNFRPMFTQAIWNWVPALLEVRGPWDGMIVSQSGWRGN